MTFDPVLTIQNMPFCLGAMETPYNPNGLPSVYPFRLEVNYELSRLEQVAHPALTDLLAHAYKVGAEMGTPSDSTDFGKPYVDDFISFINKLSTPGGKLLEIGAGTGFLSKSLMDAGWHVTAVEPGRGYANHWGKYGVSVINDFFPSQAISGTFDVVVFYTVLEHIKDTRMFLNNVRRHLCPNGVIFVGVPDCSMEIHSGDLGMLLHEHYQYFTVSALSNTLRNAGFKSVVELSSYGRSLFAAGWMSQTDKEFGCYDESELMIMQNYSERAMTAKEVFSAKLLEWSGIGSVGIFCPSRILNYLNKVSGYRFFDDAAHLQGKFYPPFCSKIMGRDELLADPPHTTFVASRTFGSWIKHELMAHGLSTDVISLEEVLP